MNMNKSNEMVIAGKLLKEVAFELNVLLVEDDAMLQRELKLFLSRFFSRVDTADNGLEALEKFQTKEYDLILTDLTMPLMGGIELAKKVKSQKESQRIMVISAHSESDKLIELINIGVDGFLLKPLETPIVIKQLTKTCKVIYDSKMLIYFNRMLEETNKELANRNLEFETTLNELTNIKKNMKPLPKVLDDAKDSLYTFYMMNDLNVENINEYLQGLDDSFNLMLVNSTNYTTSNTLNVIQYILVEYAKELEAIPIFHKVRYSLQELKEALLLISDESKVLSGMPMFISFFENLENWRKTIFEYKNLDNIHKIDNLLVDEALNLKDFLIRGESGTNY